MPRRARLRLAGLPLHIIQRGNNRGACFFAPNDRLLYLSHLHEQAQRFDCAIRAYALMTNHVHLLLTPSTPEAASLLMKHLGQRYVQYVNRTHGRSGTLWEGRFRSSIDLRERAAAYRALFDTGLGADDLTEIRLAANGGFALGDDRFKHDVSEALARRAARGIPGRPHA